MDLPNRHTVLLIMDDMPSQFLSMAEHPDGGTCLEMYAPELAALVATKSQFVYLHNHYAGDCLCCPNRACLYAAQLESHHNVLGNHLGDQFDWRDSIFVAARRHDIRTAFIGKCNNGFGIGYLGSPSRSLPGLDYTFLFRGGAGYFGKGDDPDPESDDRPKPLDYISNGTIISYGRAAKKDDGTDWVQPPPDDEYGNATTDTNDNYSTMVLFAKTITALQTFVDRGDPSLTVLALKAPHGTGAYTNPRNPALITPHPHPDYLSAADGGLAVSTLYDGVTSPLDDNPSFNLANYIADRPAGKSRPPFYQQTTANPRTAVQEDNWRIGLQWQLITCKSVDDGIADLFAAATTMGILDRLDVIIMTDNGVANGEHRQGRKGFIYDTAARIPTFWYTGGNANSAATSSTDRYGLFSTIDVGPTILERHGVKMHHIHDGASAVTMLLGDDTTEHRAALLQEHSTTSPSNPSFDMGIFRVPAIEGGSGRGVFKYARYRSSGDAGTGGPNGGSQDEAYDIEADPFELYNLVDDTNDPDGAEAVRRYYQPKLDQLVAGLGPRLSIVDQDEEDET